MSSDHTNTNPVVQPSAQRAEDTTWWKKAVIYQIYPRSFQDHNADGIGDIRGIEDRLDYLEELGVTAIWISPFFRSPMKDFGYDVENHRDVDPIFGSLADFERLVNQAHRRNIRVLIDLVLSHTADCHPWFAEARTSNQSKWSDCYVWADANKDGGPPNNWLSIFGGPAWTFEPQRNQYYLHNFLSSQPDLNFHCLTVQEEALDIARWWLERGVDGFRLDTVNFYFHDQELRNNPLAPHPDDQVVSTDNPYSLQDHVYDKNQPQVCGFLSRLGDLLAEFPGTIALGEVGATQERARELMEQYQQPGRLHLCYTFDLLSPHFSASHFRNILERDANETSNVWRCLAFSNHDIRRTASRFTEGTSSRQSIAHAAMAMLLSLRGTPCIYQGEELGLTEADIPYHQLVDPYGIAFWPKFKGRDGCRTPMPWSHLEPQAGFTRGTKEPWLPIPTEHREMAVDVQKATSDSLFHKTRQLVALHQSHPAFHGDTLKVLDSPNNMLVYERGDGDSTILCLFNLSEHDCEIKLPDAWSCAPTLAQGGAVHPHPETGMYRYEAWAWRFLSSQSEDG